MGIAYSMEKRVLSTWHSVLMPPGRSSFNSAHVSPSLAEVSGERSRGHGSNPPGSILRGCQHGDVQDAGWKRLATLHARGKESLDPGHSLAWSSFCVVAMTLGNSWMAGRNFSCKSQTLTEASAPKWAGEASWRQGRTKGPGLLPRGAMACWRWGRW